MERKLGCQPPYMAPVDQKIEIFKILKDVGFTHYFFCLENNKKGDAEKLLNAADNIGLKLDEIHAPYANINFIWCDDEHGEKPANMLLESLRFCADHNVGTMVVHDSSGLFAPDMSNAGLARFRRLFEEANKLGVKIAMENLRRTNFIARIFHENRDLPVYYCWDCGHENCFTPGVEHLALFSDRLVCTHIHDNSGIYTDDDHILPFDGTTDWAKKAELIKASGYDGPLTLEVDRWQGRYRDWSHEKFYQEAYKRIAKFAEMCGR